MSGFGEYPRGSGDPALRHKLTGFGTAKVNRTQRSGGQAEQGNGGFGNQGNTSQPGRATHRAGRCVGDSRDQHRRRLGRRPRLRTAVLSVEK
ncbi:hypothetical protein HTS88_18715 [Pseudarthrobacter oxydans]|nr:hypothetical protein [Pseudarthrobacter oxydans]